MTEVSEDKATEQQKQVIKADAYLGKKAADIRGRCHQSSPHPESSKATATGLYVSSKPVEAGQGESYSENTEAS